MILYKDVKESWDFAQRVNIWKIVVLQLRRLVRNGRIWSQRFSFGARERPTTMTIGTYTMHNGMFGLFGEKCNLYASLEQTSDARDEMNSFDYAVLELLRI
ncbi:hypothetical protein MUK42_35005 [Musa troglodytarum]|uniref:Uncharacterized protein n=1 Tax=Musa troglodytarum TaxID=320322 RepID=A0A9E7E7S7_9LILI|nr:hypothetical protein MUK42_35005 [Musa troglodytarum]